MPVRDRRSSRNSYRSGRRARLFVGFSAFALLGLGSPLAPTAVGAAEQEALPGPTERRLPPMPESAWSPEVRALLLGTQDRVASLEGGAVREPTQVLAILRTMAYHPKLMKPFLGFATAIAQQGALARRDSELLALRAAWNCRSDFEWGHHVVYARAAGLSDGEIARIAEGPDAKGWSAADRDLLLAADQLHARQQVDDALWQRLAARFDPAQLVELPFVVGQYTMLSMLANMTGVVLEPGHDPLPPAAQNR